MIVVAGSVAAGLVVHGRVRGGLVIHLDPPKPPASTPTPTGVVLPPNNGKPIIAVYI